MGRSRKRFNEKARQTQKNEVIRAENVEVEIDIQIQEEKYDSNNPLVICSKKKEKIKGPVKEVPVVKPLSRKQKKKLANILAKKKKKLNRAELLEKLSKVQARPEDLNFLTSTASMQTHGVKKLIQENSVEKDSGRLKISNIKGSRKKNMLPPKKKIKLPPNVVGFESSSSDTDSEVSEGEDANNKAIFDATDATFVSNDNMQETDLVNCTNFVEESGLNFVSGSINKQKTESNIVELEYGLQKTLLKNNSSDQVPEILQPVNQDLEIQDDAVDDTGNDLLICEGKESKIKAPHDKTSVSKRLSKKQMKKLKGILAKKSKKLNKEVLWEKLRRLQVDVKDLNSLMCIASVQTPGTKRLFQCDSTGANTNIKRKKKGIAQYSKNESQSDASFVGIECDSPEIDDGKTKGNEVENICIPDNSDAQGRSFGSSVMDNQKTKENSVGHVTDSVYSESIVTKEIHSSENTSEEYAKQTVIDKTKRSPAVFVPLNRLPEIQAAREALPIFCEEQAIMEAIHENSVVVIHGNTGSGKTTQVPQFLYEGGYAQNKKIAVTEPRRIAAMTMAARVGTEMNLPDVVAYHVRYENNVTEETKITFMTDGVLLKEIRRDFYLSDYSVVIVDEAHERSVFSDVLIGLLSRIVPGREKKGNPLKLIIMSATMRVEEFIENPKLFKEPPFLIQLDSRQYKVDVHFNTRTPIDYIEATYHKVCKIHNQLPAGAILVFLTGEKEVTKLCKMLRNRYPFKNNAEYTSESMDIKNAIPESSNYSRKKKKKQKNDASFWSVPQIDLNDYAAEPLDTENMQHQLSDEEEDSHIDSFHPDEQDDFMPLYTLPLYSVLPFHEQQKVFQPPPPGSRLCVVSTNVAETSITIPGLKYVVDSGKVKTKVCNTFAGGISQFCIEWTSKASANQRAGRAGRTEGGHCYRLYSSSVFEHEFPDFSPPEIQRIPVDDVLLQMKALGIVTVVNFPFPSPPDPEALKSAERRLVHLGAVENLIKDERYKDMKKWEYSGKITQLGSAMARFPLSPRYAKMLVVSYKHQCISYIVAIVSAMTVPHIFLTSDCVENSNSESKLLWKGIKNINGGRGKSLELGDMMVLLRAVALFEDSKNNVQFCIKNRIRHKAMVEIHKMRLQLHREVNRTFTNLDLSLELKIDPPNEEQIEKLRKILTTGFTDHVARLFSEEEMKLNKDLKNAYKCLDLEDPVFIHPSSVLFSELPRYIIYQEIVHTSKYYMKGIVEINPGWLPAFAPTMCEFSAPLEEPVPYYDSEKDQILCSMNVTFGPWQWELPAVINEMPKSILKYTWFSFFLLNGQVYNFFNHYKKHLFSYPETLLKPWAKSLPRVRYLLYALFDKSVDSKESLVNMWSKEPQFLLREYCEWLPQEKHMEIECKWPPKS